MLHSSFFSEDVFDCLLVFFFLFFFFLLLLLAQHLPGSTVGRKVQQELLLLTNQMELFVLPHLASISCNFPQIQIGSLR